MEKKNQIGTENAVQIDSTMFNRVVALFNHLKEGIGKIVAGKHSNEDFISLGRSEEEKELIQEIVEEIDKQYEFIDEIEKEGRGVDLEEWYKKKEAEIMKDLNDEEKKILSEVVCEYDREEEKTIIDSTNQMVDCYDTNTIENMELNQNQDSEAKGDMSNIKSE